MSFPSYPAYKDSGVEWLGEVPAHWEEKPFFSLIKERSVSNSGMKQNNLLSLSYGRIINKDINALDGLLPTSFETYQVVYPGDIIFRLTDLQNDKRSLRSAIVREIGIITSAYLAGACIKILPDFANHLFRAYDTLKVFYSMGGGLRQSMKYSDMKWLPILLPNEQEQSQIAHFLDHETTRIDALIEEQQRLIELLKEKRQAVISHAVTKGLDPTVPMKDSGVEWLGEVPAHWTVTKLKFITKHVVDCPHETPIYDPDGNYLVVRTADLDQGILKSEQMYRLQHDEYIHRTRRMTVEKNDVVYSREGERWGHAALIPESNLYALGQRMMQLRASNSTCPNFFMYQLNSLTTYRQGEVDTVGATAPHVNISTVINYCVMSPPKDEQVQISQYLNKTLSSLDCLIGESLEMKELLQERRSALISAAVTGKIDVRGWQPPASATSPELAQEAV